MISIGSYNKYHNTKVHYDNVLFDSKQEMRRYRELKLLEKAGKITHLELQPEYILLDPYLYQGKKIRGIIYIADFRYIDCEKMSPVIEDCKGHRTKEYLLKRKLLLSQNPGIIFREV